MNGDFLSCGIWNLYGHAAVKCIVYLFMNWKCWFYLRSWDFSFAHKGTAWILILLQGWCLWLLNNILFAFLIFFWYYVALDYFWHFIDYLCQCLYEAFCFRAGIYDSFIFVLRCIIFHLDQSFDPDILLWFFSEIGRGCCAEGVSEVSWELYQMVQLLVHSTCLEQVRIFVFLQFTLLLYVS